MLLVEPYKSKVENLIDEGIAHFKNDEASLAIDKMNEAWNAIPYPRVNYDESYHLVKKIINICIMTKQPENAYKWVNICFIADLERIDTGEREFLAGKVAFECNDLINAKELFFIANQKSGGRCFGPKDGKYLKFFKSK